MTKQFIIEKNELSLTATVTRTTFEAEHIKEKDLEKLIIENMDILRDDDQSKLMFIDNQTRPSTYNSRLDILAIDMDFNVIIIELKRTQTAANVDSQIFKYISVMQDTTCRTIIELYMQKHSCSLNVAETRILDFLGWNNLPAYDEKMNIQGMIVTPKVSRDVEQTLKHLHKTSDIIIPIRVLTPYTYDNNKIFLKSENYHNNPTKESSDIHHTGVIKDLDEHNPDDNPGIARKFEYNTKIYSGREIALLIVKQYVEKFKPKSIDQLVSIFNENVKDNRHMYSNGDHVGIFIDIRKIPDGNEKRFFCKYDEYFKFRSGVYVLTNEWCWFSVGRIVNIGINHVKMDITEITSKLKEMKTPSIKEELYSL